MMEPDGTLHCLGRLSDGQIKLRGQRIELGEIEHAALRTPGCHDASATTVASNLVLFCAVDPGVNQEAVEGSCRSWLPRFMVPNEIILMAGFPRLSSGKTDRKKLRADFISKRENDNRSDKDSGKLSSKDQDLLTTISTLLGRQVNMQTVLGAAGLDSLSAIKLAAALRVDNPAVSIFDLLKLETVGDLKTYLQEEMDSPKHVSFGNNVSIPDEQGLLSILSDPVERIAPCAHLQSAMLATTAQNSELYCNEIFLTASSSVDLASLARAFTETIQRNEVLRTGFVFWKDQYVSVVFRGPRTNQVVMAAPGIGGTFSLRQKEDFLKPFRVYLTQNPGQHGPSVVIRAHHAVYDGWSIDMLVSDVCQLLRGSCLQTRAQFSDVVKFHSSTTDTSKNVSRTFWGEALLGWNKVPFPKLLGSPGLDEIRSVRTNLDISPAAVGKLSQNCGISAAVLFQAALALAWTGVIGHTDVLLGSVFSGRAIPVDGIDCVLGPCIATVPLRVTTENVDSVDVLLKRIHTTNRHTMEHCHLPLSEIRKLAGLCASEPLFDVLFVYQQPFCDDVEERGVLRQTGHIDRLETNLLVEVEPKEHAFTLQATYHTQCVDTCFADEFLEQMKELCARILLDQTQDLKTIRKLNRAPLSAYPVRLEPHAEPDDVAELFDASVRRNPDAEALRFATAVDNGELQVTTMSYSKLSRTAVTTAFFLREKGAHIGDVVTIMMNKSVALYTSIIGIIKAGCAYLPILPSTPVARVKEILQQSGTTICLTDQDILDPELLSQSVSFVNIHSMPSEDCNYAQVPIPPDPDRLSYVIFTSGTTGVPKGVAVSQRNLASNIARLSAIYPITAPRPRLLQACSQAFDVSAFEIFYAWFTGMSLCAADNDIIFNDLEHTIREMEVTHLSLTPTVAALVNPANVPRVEFLVTAGEPMTSSVLHKWKSLLFQGYGPSETTNICSVKRMSGQEHIEHLGWVLPNTSVFVLGQGETDLLPRGWVGEFCFGGSQVARGYLNNESLTGEKFIQHPSFGRLYRSGDLGRMLCDGSLVILGRLDDQLKLRGQRIEAGEINSILTNMNGITAAVTLLVRPFRGHTDHLATFYNPAGSTKGSAPLEISQRLQNRLIATLKSRLPSYMVPSYLVPVSCIPMTSSGKVDKRHLDRWFESLADDYLATAAGAIADGTEGSDQWTAMEMMVAQAVSETCSFPAKSVGRWTPFTALGIDSISAIGVSRAISLRLGSPVSISSILQNPTAAQLSHLLTSGDGVKSSGSSQAVESLVETLRHEVLSRFRNASSNFEAVLPCIPLQEAMLSRDQSCYYNKTLLKVHARPDDMCSYWKQVAERHGILRTCFVTTKHADHPIAQIILRKWELPWREITVTNKPFEHAIQEHLRLLPEALDSLLPPYSLAIIDQNGLKFLSFICHHALYDGIAMENIWREVECMAQGHPLLPPVPYLPFLAQALSLPIDMQDFWRKEFRGFQGSQALAPSAQPTSSQLIHTVFVDLSLSKIRETTRSLGVSLLSLCQSSWAAVLFSIFGHPDVTFGNVVSGRTLGVDGLERLIAPCFNTIPLRVNMLKSGLVLDLIKYFQRLNARLLRYQFSPLKLIQKAVLAPRRTLFNTLLLLQQPLREMDENLWVLEHDVGDMDIPVVCEISPCTKSDTLTVDLHFDPNVITKDMASAIAETFRYMIRSLIMFPFQSLPKRSSLPTSITSALPALTIKSEENNKTLGCKVQGEDWSDLERRVCSVFAKLANVSESCIHRDTTIFEIGLDSINAVQIASELRAHGFPVSSSDVVECASSEKLANRIKCEIARTSQGHKSLDVPAFSSRWSDFSKDILKSLDSQAGIEAVLPCTVAQNAMLVAFIQRASGDYLNFLSFNVRGNIGVQVLENAWRRLQQHHPMLRTSFVSTKHSESAFAMLRRDHRLSLCPIEVYERSERAFDLDKWRAEARHLLRKDPHAPLWKVALVRDEGTETVASMHLAIHHSLYDAHSLHEMLSGLSQLLMGEPCKFSAVEPALAQLLERAHREDSEARKFWQGLASSAIVNKFPTMTPLRQAKQTFAKQATLSVSINEVHLATKSIGASLQAVLQAVWARLLASYLGERSVVFGVVLAGRTTDETLSAPFPCLTTVPVVVEAVESNTRLISTMMEYNSNLHKYQYSPLTEIQKWLGHPSRSVFDTVLVYQKLASSPCVAMDFELSSDEASVEYAVSLEVEPSASGHLIARISSRTDIMPIEQASLVLQQFDLVLRHLLRSPLGTEHELYETKPEIFSISPADIFEMKAPVKTVHEFVQMRAESEPDTIALEFVESFEDDGCGRKTWTYKELNAMGNKVAHLISAHVRVGDVVAVHFSKCPEAYFSILGILKAGCAFVALDPSAPQARKEFIISDSRAVCLLTDANSSISLPKEILVLSVTKQKLALFPSSPSLSIMPLRPENTCYCLYTSGTTGTPKGCEITHENTVQALMAFQHLFKGHWEAGSRWLQFAAFHFDVSVLEQYWSWSVGITVVAAPRELILDDLVGSVKKLAITHIDLTPSLARLTHPDELPDLCKGVFITGGEQLNQEVLDAWGPKAVIYNAYGPTEATIGVTMFRQVPVNGRPSNIGKQFPNVGTFVLQKGTEIPVLRGGIGELCLAGKLVGKGYLHRPELTKDKFPVLSSFGERVYRTGDLVRLLHDGCFDFLGRADDQVKLRGQRLEMGEINHVIRSAQGISDAATLVMRYGGKDVLVAFLQGENRSRTDLRILDDDCELARRARSSCLDKLPGYMVPTYFILLNCIPLSSNNKVETKQLKSLFDGLSPSKLIEFTGRNGLVRDRSIDPRIYSSIVEVLKKFCSISENTIRQTTSVFDLGIDSISALQLSTLFKAEGFPVVSAAMILRRPIIADLVEDISFKSGERRDATNGRKLQQALAAWRHRHSGQICQELGIPPDDLEYIVPCSPLQEGMVSKAFSEDLLHAYFNWFDFHLENGTTTSAFREAWGKTISDHAILRSQFLLTADGYMQFSLKKPGDLWRDVSVEKDTDVQAAMKRETSAWLEKNNTPHISRPLLFVQVNGPCKRAVRLLIFHGLYDGYSFDLMNEHANRHYRLEDHPEGPEFVEALYHGPLQNFDSCKPFWVEHLSGWQFAPLPTMSTPGESVGQAVSVSRLISLEKLEALRSQENVTLQVIVLSIWAVVLQQYISRPCAMGVIVSGRCVDLPRIENTVGPLFNTVPFLQPTMDGFTWSRLVQRCQKFHTDLLSFQHVPLRDIQKWCSNSQPLFDNLFTFQLARHDSTSEGLPWSVSNGNLNGTEYALAFEATQTPEGTLSLLVTAHPLIANSDVLDGLLDKFDQIVTNVKPETTWVLHPQEQTQTTNGARREVQSVVDSDAPIPPHFEWTPTAMAIRSELSSVACVELKDIRPDTTIFELGLDSIDVMKVSARLSKRGTRLSASQIMRHQDILKMSVVAEASMMANGHGGASGAEDIAETQKKMARYLESKGLEMDDVELVLPTTPLQQALVATMVQSDFDWYFNHDVLELGTSVDMARLREAWLELIASSPILRTGFVEVDDDSLDMAYCQVVSKQPFLQVTTERIRDASELRTFVTRAIDSARTGQAREGLLQVTLASCSDKKYMVISMAHALYDAWSLRLLYDDLESAYTSKLTTREYFQPLASRNDIFGAGVADDGFWRSYLFDAHPTIMPARNGELQGQQPEQAVSRTELLSSVAMSDIIAFCKRTSISVHSLCMSCWAIVAASLSRSLDVTFGAVLSGRDFDGADQLVFPTFNTIAVRCVLHGSASSFLQYMESNLADLRDHQRTPLRQIQTVSGNGGKQLFNSLFILQKSWANKASEPMWHSVDGIAAAEYPICAEAEPMERQLAWRVACQASHFTRQEAEDVAGKMDRVLGFFLESADSDIMVFNNDSVSICGLTALTLKEPSVDAAPDPPAHQADQDFAWNETSLRVREVLSRVSGHPADSISPNSTLYHLGLDSISAIKVSLMLRRANIDLKPRDLVQAVSIGDLMRSASRSDEAAGPGFGPRDTWTLPPSVSEADLAYRCEIATDNIEAILPSSSMQIHMLSAWQTARGTVFYPSFSYKASSSFSHSQLMSAWSSVVKRLPILRVRMVSTGTRDVPWVQILLKHEGILAGRVPQPLHFFEASRDGDDEAWSIRLSVHHALYDAFSLSAIMQLYNKILLSGSAPDEESTAVVSSKEWETFCSEPRRAAQIERRRKFWTRYLAGFRGDGSAAAALPPRSLPPRRVSYLRKKAVSRVTAMQKLAASHGIGLQSLFLAAFAKNLHRADHGRSERILFGVYLANRATGSNSLDMTFPTLSLVPLIVDVQKADDALVDVAINVHRSLQRIQNEGMAQVGLWEIYEWTGLKLNTFVNFISLADSDGPDNAEGAAIRESDDDAAVAEERHCATFKDEPWMQNNVVKDAYPVCFRTTNE